MHSWCVSVRTRGEGRQGVALVSPLLAVSSARVPPASGCVSLVSVPQPVKVPRSLRRALVSYAVGSLRGTLPGGLTLGTRWHPHILVLKHHPDDASHSSQSLQWPPTSCRVRPHLEALPVHCVKEFSPIQRPRKSSAGLRVGVLDTRPPESWLNRAKSASVPRISLRLDCWGKECDPRKLAQPQLSADFPLVGTGGGSEEQADERHGPAATSGRTFR